ncbi:MAG: hypothetical protein HRT65_15755 [Flavobacteriaceae bacterium]|nr:hypothetical protein [Flavobacteriaceae bacterium]
MKALKRNTVAVALLFAAATGLANGPKINEVEKNLLEVNSDPVFTKKGNKLFMNLLNLDQEKVTIKVMDSNGRVVFKQVLEGDLVVEKAFNFEQAYSDSYTVIIVDDNKTYKETVEVK